MHTPVGPGTDCPAGRERKGIRRAGSLPGESLSLRDLPAHRAEVRVYVASCMNFYLRIANNLAHSQRSTRVLGGGLARPRDLCDPRRCARIFLMCKPVSAKAVV